MITAMIGMFIAVLAFASHLSPSTMRRLVGYGLVVDVGVFVLCLTLFGGTGTERLGAIGASIGITLALHTYKRLWGYERYVDGRWRRYAGLLTRRQEQ